MIKLGSVGVKTVNGWVDKMAIFAQDMLREIYEQPGHGGGHWTFIWALRG